MSIDSPTSELVRSLARLGIDAASVRSCQGHLARLARGLPVTDSLWIDALRQAQLLTPWQARRLETAGFNDLLIEDRWVVTAPWHLDSVLATFSARSVDRRRQVSIGRMTLAPESAAQALLRLQKVINTLEPVRSQFPWLPFEVVATHGRLDVIQPAVPGDPLSRLLVRRGRFPEPVVREIALQLVSALAAIESLGLHGDLRLSNLALDQRGHLAVVNWGVLSAATPLPSLHVAWPLDAWDGLSPERWTVDREVSLAGEIYACGCLLWQLLSGRPTQQAADPVLKMQAHATRGVADVRSVAPETSASLAELIRGMTARDPLRRPRSFAEVREALRTGPRPRRASLREFSQSFARPVTRGAGSPSRRAAGNWKRIAAVAVLAAVGTGIAWNRDRLGLPNLAGLGAAVSPAPGEFTPLSSPPRDRQSELPQPAADGTVQLDAGATYAAGELSHNTRLILRGDPQSPAIIRVVDLPLKLGATSVSLENVIIVTGEGRQPLPALLEVASRELLIKHCRWSGADTIRAAADNDAGGALPAALIDWRSQLPDDPQAGRLLIADTALTGAAVALRVRSPLTTALLDNVLASDVERVLVLEQATRTGLRVPLVVQHSTLRAGEAIVSLSGESLAGSGRLSLRGAGTVLDTPAGVPLIEILGGDPTLPWESHVEIDAESWLSPEGRDLVAYRTQFGTPPLPLDPGDLSVRGLVAGRFHWEATAPPAPPGMRLIIESPDTLSGGDSPGARPERHPALPVSP